MSEEVYVCDSRAIPFYSFDDKQNKYKRILYLGTHITTKSLNWGFYYFGVGNMFWSIIKKIYNSESLTQAIEDYKEDFKMSCEFYFFLALQGYLTF